MQDIIPIFFTFNKYYVVAAEVAIYSLLVHASRTYKYKLYILHTDIPYKSIQALKHITQKFPNAIIEFINTSSYDNQQEIPKGKAHFSKEIYYKLIAADLFPQYDRIICSDVDVVFTGDISPSFFMHKNESFCFAGVGQILESGRMKTYEGKFTIEEQNILKKEIAGGYMLMNLKTIRELGMQEKLTAFYKTNYPRLCLPEQDTIILCCHRFIRYLPLEYLVCNSYYHIHNKKTINFYKDNDGFPKNDQQALDIFTQALKCPIQLHYVGESKPWNGFNVPKQRIWFQYLWQSGATQDYLRMLPIFWIRRLRKYSIKRFYKRILKKIIYSKTNNNEQ